MQHIVSFFYASAFRAFSPFSGKVSPCLFAGHRGANPPIDKPPTRRVQFGYYAAGRTRRRDKSAFLHKKSSILPKPVFLKCVMIVLYVFFLQKNGFFSIFPPAAHNAGSKKEFCMGKQLIYENPLACEEDLRGFRLEGQAKLSFPQGALRMESALDAAMGQKANYVLWCPEVFPADFALEWSFRPLTDRGLCILFFAAAGRGGEDLFSPALTPRTGEYAQYHHGDINAFHISYFRRKEPDERAFHLCNLRKSYGFYLVAQGADPLPDAADASGFYALRAVKFKNKVDFFINDLPIFSYLDDGASCGPVLAGGRIGFRQLAPLQAEYRDLRVYRL